MLDLLYLLESFIPNLAEAIGVIGAITLIFGLANTFFGYKLFKILLAIIGFLAGAVGGFLVFLYAGDGAAGSDAMTVYILIGGAIGSAIAEGVHKLGVFLVVGAMGVIIAFLSTQNAQVSLVLGIVCGIAGALLEKYVIMLRCKYTRRSSHHVLS